MDNGKLYQAVGSHIKEARIAKNWTQAQLAEALGKSRATVAQIESGVQKVSLDMLYNIASLFKCQIQSLLPAVSELPIDNETAKRVSIKDQGAVMELLDSIKPTKEYRDDI